MKKALFSLIILFIVLISGCQDKEKLAVQTAQGFAIAWQNKDYNSLYDYFSSALKSERNKEDFVKFITASNPTDFLLIYDKAVVQNNKEAYAYYTSSGNYVFQPKSPAVHMVFENGEWKMDAFATYFISNCAVDSCDDLNVCTSDICNYSTDFSCKHIQIDGCCIIDYNYYISNFSCPEDKPHCHENKCYKEECLKDEDCSTWLPFCVNGNCVKCRSNTDCLSYHPICSNNKCVLCAVDSDCTDKNHPQCSNNECVQCITDSDCVRWGWQSTFAGKIYYTSKCKKSVIDSSYNTCVE